MHTTYGYYIILLYYESIHSNTRLYSMHTTTVCILADEKASEERKVSFFAHPHSEWNTVKEFVDRSHPTIYMWRLFFGAGRRCHAVAAVAATMGLYGEGAPLSCESSSGVSSSSSKDASHPPPLSPCPIFANGGSALSLPIM